MKIILIALLVQSFVISGCQSKPDFYSKKSAQSTSIEKPQYREFGTNGKILDLSKDLLVKVSKKENKGFNYPYYLFIPKTLDRNKKNHLYVEPNNTGTVSDDFKVHDKAARNLVENSYPNRIARELNSPLLVPVFPRPSSMPNTYTHYLDRDTLLIKTGKLKRIDLQLVSMIKDAQEILKSNGVAVEPKIFMHGFSASAGFTNRFTLMHPEIVRASAAGGINGIAIFPLSEWKNNQLRYAVGISDLEEITGIKFNKDEYLKVSQYLYMGYLDANDTVLYSDAWDKEDAALIKRLFGEKMMPDRWTTTTSIYKQLNIPAQLITYNSTNHQIKPEMQRDLVRFFRANEGNEIVTIKPYKYPFVEYKQLKEVHIKSVYWRGSESIPKGFARDLNGAHFILCINEWIKGQDYKQLDDFLKNAGISLILKSNQNDKDIVISNKNISSTMSDGNGEFQGFVIRLDTQQLKDMVYSGNYSIMPVNKSKTYLWKVNKGVTVQRSK